MNAHEGIHTLCAMAVAGSSASSSGFMAEQSRVLLKLKVKELVGMLKPKQSELSRFVTGR